MLGRFRVAVQYRAPAVASCYLASRPERAGLLRNEVKRDDGASPVRVVLGRTISNRGICDPLMWRRRGVRFAVGAWAERGGEPFTHAAARGGRAADARRDRRDRSRNRGLRAVEEVVPEDRPAG